MNHCSDLQLKNTKKISIIKNYLFVIFCYIIILLLMSSEKKLSINVQAFDTFNDNYKNLIETFEKSKKYPKLLKPMLCF
jgi:hypothetical protein